MSRSQLPLNALRAFEAAARHASFTHAAEELHVTQAAVSHQVKALEERLGVALFVRRPRGLEITSEGEALLPDLRERTCFTTATELLNNKGLSDASYAAAEKTLGLKDLVAVVASVGNFSMTCLTAGTFGIEPPADNPIPLAK